MFFQQSHSFLVLSIQKNCRVLVEQSQKFNCHSSLNLYAVKFFILYAMYGSLTFWMVIANEITELCKQFFTTYQRYAFMITFISSWMYVYTSIAIHNSTPKIFIVFENIYFGVSTFGWNNSEFRKICNYLLTTNLKSKMVSAIYSFICNGFFEFNFVIRQKKISEFNKMLKVFFRYRKINSSVKYISICYKHTYPVGAFWRYTFKTIFIYNVGTACSYFYSRYIFFTHGKPHLLVGQGRFIAANDNRPVFMNVFINKVKAS